MRVYDESTSRRAISGVFVNWSRELTFSERQIGFIQNNLPDDRGVYCIYAKDYLFSYSSPKWTTNRWSGIVYIGSGCLSQRLSFHLAKKKNNILEEYLSNHNLAYRYDRIADDLEDDWSRIVEASLLHFFVQKFGALPPANRRKETIPELELHTLNIRESSNFSVLR